MVLVEATGGYQAKAQTHAAKGAVNEFKEVARGKKQIAGRGVIDIKMEILEMRLQNLGWKRRIVRRMSKKTRRSVGKVEVMIHVARRWMDPHVSR